MAYKYNVIELEPKPEHIPPEWNNGVFPVELTRTYQKEFENSVQVIKHDQESNSWPLFDNGSFTCLGGALKHRVPCFGYIIKEKDTLGSLNVAKLKELGLTPGPMYAKLKKGISVTTDSGLTIDPKDVTGPTKVGKKVVILGDTCDSSELKHLCTDADLICHEATMEEKLREKCVEYGHSTPRMAAEFARDVRARVLCLFHVSPRYRPVSACAKEGDEIKVKSETGDESEVEDVSANILLSEAREFMAEARCDSTKVDIAEDFYELKV